ncbi:MAG: Gfo/Idh/MocA family oxidoreductase [Hyphomicrobiaceae bacterium]
MTQVRIAVVGAGLIGRTHIAVLKSHHPDFTLAGVADPSPVAAEEGRALGYPVYPSMQALIASESPDGVLIATPNQTHVPLGLEAIARGLPILVEKPLADSVASAARLVVAGRRAGIAIQTAHHRRHNPVLRRAAEILKEGSIGRLVAVTACYLSHKPAGYHDLAWRREPGGGPVLINAIHDIDCLRMLAGEIESVQAFASNAVRGFAVEDTAAAALRFSNGALGTLVCSDTASSPWSWEWGSRENPKFPFDAEDCYTFSGTLGSLSVPTLVHRWHEPGRQSWETPLTSRRHHVPLADAYVEQLRNFAAVIRGNEVPAVSGEDGLRTLATTLAISRSAATRAPVDVSATVATALAEADATAAGEDVS